MIYIYIIYIYHIYKLYIILLYKFMWGSTNKTIIYTVQLKWNIYKYRLKPKGSNSTFTYRVLIEGNHQNKSVQI
jgi:hypothetical protein